MTWPVDPPAGDDGPEEEDVEGGERVDRSALLEARVMSTWAVAVARDLGCEEADHAD